MDFIFHPTTDKQLVAADAINVRHVTKKCASKTVVSCIDKSQHLDSTFKSFSKNTTISKGKISIFILTVKGFFVFVEEEAKKKRPGCPKQ